MRVLGVDPGTYRMGAGVVETDGDSMRWLASDVLCAGKSDPLQKRLHTLYNQTLALIEQWRPDAVAVEEPFVALNPRTALAIGQAEATALIAASVFDIPTFTYTPRQIKKSVADHGGASKEQVLEMVGVHLGLSHSPQSLDASDALAAAICHVHHSFTAIPVVDRL